MRRKWFSSESRELVFDETRARALFSSTRAIWPATIQNYGSRPSYDVIFCRNVLMYFAPEQMRAAIVRIAASLAPGGYLFLGHAETLRGVSDDFHLCHTHGTFYYRRKERIAPARGRRAQDGRGRAPHRSA